MVKEKEECKNCAFFRDWGIPIFIALIIIIIFLGYKDWELGNSNSACFLVFNETLFERNELAINLTVCKTMSNNTDIDEIISIPNVLKFCKSKGFESGGYSSYSCTGVMCITSNMESGTIITKTGCYKFSELIDYVR
jgi:hypothetical protein